MKLRRSQRGSAISEFVPALVILLSVALVIIDAVPLTIAYVSAWYLNFLEVREVSVVAKVRGGTLVNGVDVNQALAEVHQKWAASGLGNFLGQRLERASTVSGVLTPTQGIGGTGSLSMVEVATSVTVNPLLNVGFFGSIPGLSAPITFRHASTRPVENIN